MNDYERLDPRSIKSWRLARLIRTASFVLLTATVLLIMHWFETPALPFTITAAALGLLCLYSLISTFLFPAIEYRQWGYRLEEDKVIIRHGIFFIKTIVIPVIRIQNVTIKHGPIDRHYGLCSVELALATGSYDIRCLSGETANAIADNLNQRLYRRIEERGGTL